MPAVVVTVTSTALPTLRHRCRRCGQAELVCAERLRANSNGKRTDVWLLYRCAGCDATTNVTVVERVPVGRLDRRLLDEDPALVRTLARTTGLPIATGDRFEVTGADAVPPCTLDLRFPEPLLVRLDEAVAAALGTSRRRVAVDAGGARPDRLRLWSDTTVEVTGAAERASVR